MWRLKTQHARVTTSSSTVYSFELQPRWRCAAPSKLRTTIRSSCFGNVGGVWLWHVFLVATRRICCNAASWPQRITRQPVSWLTLGAIGQQRWTSCSAPSPAKSQLSKKSFSRHGTFPFEVRRLARLWWMELSPCAAFRRNAWKAWKWSTRSSELLCSILATWSWCVCRKLLHHCLQRHRFFKSRGWLTHTDW